MVYGPGSMPPQQFVSVCHNANLTLNADLPQAIQIWRPRSDVKFHETFGVKYFMKYFWNILKIHDGLWVQAV